jgi:hypothetical protein
MYPLGLLPKKRKNSLGSLTGLPTSNMQTSSEVFFVEIHSSEEITFLADVVLKIKDMNIPLPEDLQSRIEFFGIKQMVN